MPSPNYPYPPMFSPDLIGAPQPGKGQYAEYVNRLTLSRDIFISFLTGRVCVPSLMFDEKVCRAPVWAEFFLVYAGGCGIGVPTIGDIAKNDGMSGWDWTKGMQHTQTYDEVFLYLPTDPHDTLNLGGEAVEYLGDEGLRIDRALGRLRARRRVAQPQLLQAGGPALLPDRPGPHRQRQVPRGRVRAATCAGDVSVLSA